MSVPEAISYRPDALPLRQRMPIRFVVIVARLLATQSPRRIRTVLGWLHRGAAPATFEQALAARNNVVAVSLSCAAPEGCLTRSLAVVLLCRVHGYWPTWCVGARRMPPFGAHAWVEVEGVPVNEGHPPDYFRTFFSVPDRGSAHVKVAAKSHGKP